MHSISHYFSSPSHYIAAAAAGEAPVPTLTPKTKQNQYFISNPKFAQLSHFNEDYTILSPA